MVFRCDGTVTKYGSNQAAINSKCPRGVGYGCCAGCGGVAVGFLGGMMAVVADQQQLRARRYVLCCSGIAPRYFRVCTMRAMNVCSCRRQCVEKENDLNGTPNIIHNRHVRIGIERLHVAAKACCPVACGCFPRQNQPCGGCEGWQRYAHTHMHFPCYLSAQCTCGRAAMQSARCFAAGIVRAAASNTAHAALPPSY